MQVTVTLTVDTANPPKWIKFELDQEPIDLSKCKDDEDITWKLVTASGWTFTEDSGHKSNGVVIKNHANKFKDKKGGSRKDHTWQRQGTGGTYHYTISVTDGTYTASWDPTIRN